MAHDAIPAATNIPSNLLSLDEQTNGYQIIGPYINEKQSPVPIYCFVRLNWIIQRPPFMSKFHGNLITQLMELIRAHLHLNNIKNAGSRVIHALRINIRSLNLGFEEILPDLVVLPFPLEGDITILPENLVPILIIEVLSDSTAFKDLTIKKKALAKLGVKNYWILTKTDDPQIGIDQSHVFQLRGDKYIDKTGAFQESGVLFCPELADLTIKAEALWMRDDSNEFAFLKIQSDRLYLKEKQRADAEKQRADQAEKRLKDLEDKFLLKSNKN